MPHHLGDVVCPKLDGDSHLLETLLNAFAGKKGVLREDGATLKRTFQDEDLMVRVEGVLDKAGYKTKLSEDEEHGLWEIDTTTNSGAAVTIDWNFASYVEFQKAVELMRSLDEVQECHYVAGEFSCLVKVKVPDRQALRELVLDRLNSLDGVRQTRTLIVLETAKETTRMALGRGASPAPADGAGRKKARETR